MRNLFQLLASSIVVGTLSTLVACGGTSAGSIDGDEGNTETHADDNPFAPPAGCLKTQCDVDFDDCIGDQKFQCEECEEDCENPFAPASCFDTCESICGDTSRSAGCASVHTSCQQSTENTQCVETVESDRESDAGSRVDSGATYAGDVDAG